MLKKYLTVWVFEQPFHGVVTGERYSYKEIPKKYQLTSVRNNENFYVCAYIWTEGGGLSPKPPRQVSSGILYCVIHNSLKKAEDYSNAKNPESDKKIKRSLYLISTYGFIPQLVAEIAARKVIEDLNIIKPSIIDKFFIFFAKIIDVKIK